MTDYIKREDAYRRLTKYYHHTRDTQHESLRIALIGIPSADVAPVRHGKWIEYGENKDGTHNMRCSKCGAGLKSKGHANSYYTKHKYRFCNNCGAKMDREETNE